MKKKPQVAKKAQFLTIDQVIIISVFVLCMVFDGVAIDPPEGFQSAGWGFSSEAVKSACEIKSWTSTTVDFPADLKVTAFVADMPIAGYAAKVTYYFCENRFFQATVDFNFSELAGYDFNYNVYRSVDQYYQAIRSKTLTFVFDIYHLLETKYGKKKPWFEGLDPRRMFEKRDGLIRQEVWNLRYHPYAYYQKIVVAAYARWDFPRTRVLFSVNIAAPEKRFDYRLSATSLDLEKIINQRKDDLRAKGL